ncbi:hypothetical protein DKL61_01785 [Gammaproteobacteria bacterium ESL0073]|nr:hypothetical protein DKL61_01785 [Gammaproteobacteria bacterium ESL0073]
MAWLIPILWAYIVPGVGTNICKVWEIRSRFQLGRFRLQHGFVFGSATSLLVWIIHQPAQGMVDIFIQSFITCSVIDFWNVLYDIIAIKAGGLYVYNQPWAQGKEPESIVLDYALWIFGGFDFCYGLVLAGDEYTASNYKLSLLDNSLFFIMGLVVCIVIPVLGVMIKSYKRYGHFGIEPCSK